MQPPNAPSQKSMCLHGHTLSPDHHHHLIRRISFLGQCCKIERGKMEDIVGIPWSFQQLVTGDVPGTKMLSCNLFETPDGAFRMHGGKLELAAATLAKGYRAGEWNEVGKDGPER